jgi:hypothetical protein
VLNVIKQASGTALQAKFAEFLFHALG